MLNPQSQALLTIFDQSDAKQEAEQSLPAITVSRAVSTLGFIYEKLRNAIEYRHDHLLRRAAIQRILTRKIMMAQQPQTMAESLVRELLWARYLPGNSLAEEKIARISQTIKKYIKTLSNISEKSLYHWTIGLASAEIEKQIIFWQKPEAIANFAFQILHQQIKISHLDQQTHDLLVFISVQKQIAKLDPELLSFTLLNLRFSQIPQDSQKLQTAYQQIQTELNHPLLEKINTAVSKQRASFLILYDLLKNPHRRQIFSAPENLQQETEKICQYHYHRTRSRVQRLVIRSIIYIFLTKMIFGLALEVPADLILAGHVRYLPLAINAISPPLLLFLLSLTIQVPGSDNTGRIFRQIKSMLSENQPSLATITIRQPNRHSFLTGIFTGLYILAFIITFGVILLVLNKLNFNFASKAVFLFFLSLVAFFAYQVKKTSHEYLIEEKESPLAPLTDFFFVPLLWLGKKVSGTIARLNIFLFIFDVIFELPFKTLFELAESWTQFIKGKKEEIG